MIGNILETFWIGIIGNNLCQYITDRNLNSEFLKPKMFITYSSYNISSKAIDLIENDAKIVITQINLQFCEATSKVSPVNKNSFKII